MSVHDVFGSDSSSLDEPKALSFDDDMCIESGDLTMGEVFGPGGEDDPMPHMDGYFTNW